MPSLPKRSSALLATGVAALLLGNLVLPDTAQAGVEVSSDPHSYEDKVVVLHNSLGKDTLVKTGVTGSNLENMLETGKKHTTELETLTKTVNEQARLIEELKRNNGSGSSSNDREMSDLKRTVGEQERDLNNLAKQVEDLKRNNGSSSSSSANELSSLKREVSDQDRELDNLKRTVEDLSRKVK